VTERAKVSKTKNRLSFTAAAAAAPFHLTRTGSDDVAMATREWFRSSKMDYISLVRPPRPGAR